MTENTPDLKPVLIQVGATNVQAGFGGDAKSSASLHLLKEITKLSTQELETILRELLEEKLHAILEEHPVFIIEHAYPDEIRVDIYIAVIGTAKLRQSAILIIIEKERLVPRNEILRFFS